MTDQTTEFEGDFNPKYYMADTFKKWHKTGFISFKYWVKEGKVQIDIGTTNSATKALVSSAKTYVDVYKFLAYLKCEVEDNAATIFPDYPDKILQIFGGSPMTKEGWPISRVFTVLPWRATKDSAPDLTARSYSCGEYKGNVTPQGAITPNYAEKLALERVKMSMFDMAELYQKLSVQVNSYAVQEANLNEVFPNG